jgi:hypothetical protein
VGASCGSNVGGGTINTVSPLQVGYWYIDSGDNVIYIQSTTTSGTLTTISQGPFSCCDQACDWLY